MKRAVTSGILSITIYSITMTKKAWNKCEDLLARGWTEYEEWIAIAIQFLSAVF